MANPLVGSCRPMEAQVSNDPRNRALREEYVARINRVIDHIAANPGETLSLDALESLRHWLDVH